MDENAAIALVQPLAPAIEQAIAHGDLSKLSPEQRLIYYREKCRSLGLNPLTQPFQYLTLNGKLLLYAKKDCTEQLRKIHGVSLKVDEPKFERDLVMVRVRGRDAQGREDEDYGYAVVAGSLKGDALGNAILKAVTKAKRRTTLSLCGLGLIDESELDSLPGAKPVDPGETFSSEGVTPALEEPQVDVRDALFAKIRGEYRGILKLEPEPKTAQMALFKQAFEISQVEDLTKQSNEQLEAGYRFLRELLHPSEQEISNEEPTTEPIMEPEADDVPDVSSEPATIPDPDAEAHLEENSAEGREGVKDAKAVEVSQRVEGADVNPFVGEPAPVTRDPDAVHEDSPEYVALMEKIGNYPKLVELLVDTKRQWKEGIKREVFETIKERLEKRLAERQAEQAKDSVGV